MKLKNLFAAALLLCSGTAMAQTDVTSTYLTNADFSSTDGWTAYVSSSFKDYGNGLIGTYGVRTAEGQAVSTVDSDHKATSYCFGFECRWNGNYASFNQTTSELPVGAYTLTYDVENTNSKTKSASYNNLFYVKVGETTYTDASTEWMSAKSSWTTHTINFNITEAATAIVSLGYGTGSNNIGSTNTPTIHVSNLKLTWTDPDAAAKAAYQTALAAAQTAIADDTYANVTGDEKTALSTAITTYSDVTSDYETATSALTTATSTFTAAKDSYDALANINAVATAVGAGTVSATNATDAAAAALTQNVAVYNAITTNYTYSVSLGDWTITGSSQNNKGQHWDGTSTTTYYEPNQWGSSSVSWNMTQDKVLPAGTYVLMATGRHSSALALSMSVLNGSTTVGTVTDFPAASSGLGVDTDGAANFSDGTFANSNNGYGWQWRYIAFTLEESTTLTFDVTATSASTHQWASICDFAIVSTTEVNTHKLALAQAITDAQAVDVTTNVGTGVFQIPASAVTTLNNAISAAQEVYNSSVTDDEYDAATTTLNAAVTAYGNTALNAPADGVKYNINVATSGHAYEGNPVIAILGTTSNNNPTGYGFNVKSAAADYLTQAFTFTSAEDAEHPNYYYISIERAEGTVYLTNGTNNGSAAGWSDSQIQGTTVSDNKMAFEIEPADVDGAFYIYNTKTSSTIAAQSGGALYTESGNPYFSVSEASEASVSLTMSAGGYATRIYPFTPTAIDGVTFYTVSALGDDNATLVLEEIETPAANVPYILYAEAAVDNNEQSDYGMAETASYTSGLLTGVYTTTAAPNESYILQKQDDVVGFYQVNTSVATPNVPANRAYLTAPAVGVKAFILSNTATAIKSVFDGAAAGEIYDIAGRKVSRMQKGGIYVINGKKVMVK